MLVEIRQLRDQFDSELEKVHSPEEAQSVRIKYLTRKGLIAQLFDNLRTIPPEDRPQIGKALNDLRVHAQHAFEERLAEVSSGEKDQGAKLVDLTLPGRPVWVGTEHPISQTLNEIVRIFTRMGFDVAEGPEIEDDYHNFEALNFPPDHPARDMQDTFFVGEGILLRTHTSPVQIRVMETRKPPVRVVVPGRVYRNEAISARSYCLFHQVEGLYVDEGVTFSDLKGTLVFFAKQFYGEKIRYRFRPSFFPFTEPSAEMDISCFLCNGKGCRICKRTGWLEILGCGMVHPNVYKYVRYDAERYTGYAFGIGIERTAMLRYGIDDIRILFENDVRFLSQF
jgi:phenylalanyl-tRNA synthetase alpha chain